MEIIFERQAELGLKVPKSVIVAGSGGVGSWVAIFLALAGVKEISLFDQDILEVHNLNRLPFSYSDVGKKKVNVLKEKLISLRPEMTILSYDRICDTNALDIVARDGEILVDCTDDFSSQQELLNWAKKNKRKYKRIGVTTNHYTVSQTLPTWGEGRKLRCGETIPAWVSPCVVAAGLGVASILRDDGKEISDEI